MIDQIFYILSAVLLGVVIGALIMYFVSNNKNKDPQGAIVELEGKLNDYKQDVSTHFEQTADLIDELTHSYKKVFDHMSHSAKKLMSEEQIKLQIQKRKGNEVTLAFLTEDESDDDHNRSDERSEEKPMNDVVQQGEPEASSDEHQLEQPENIEKPEAEVSADDVEVDFELKDVEVGDLEIVNQEVKELPNEAIEKDIESS